uniref:'chromo' domain containing protein n=1 Tax=Solanum tuberosum TaxID=4113 RepID=M1DUD4_SOLTU
MYDLDDVLVIVIVMVNTSVRPVAPVNVPAEESATRGRGRGREIEEENVEVENVKELGQEENVQAETTCIPPIDTVLAQQIMSFFKGLAGPGILSFVQATQAPINPYVASTVPKTIGMGVALCLANAALAGVFAALVSPLWRA